MFNQNHPSEPVCVMLNTEVWVFCFFAKIKFTSFWLLFDQWKEGECPYVLIFHCSLLLLPDLHSASVVLRQLSLWLVGMCAWCVCVHGCNVRACMHVSVCVKQRIHIIAQSSVWAKQPQRI